MTHAKNTCLPSAIDVALSVAEHPQFDRVIRMPAGTTNRRAAEAFLISIGVDFDRTALDDLAYDDHSFGSWTVDQPTAADYGLWGWSAAHEVPRTLTVPRFGHEVEYTYRSAPQPIVGEARFTVLADGMPLPRAGRAEPWQTATVATSIDDINHELLHRFSVVLPTAARIDAVGPHRGIVRGSRIGTLLGALTPPRRLALFAHLEAIGLLDDAPRDLQIVEEALRPMRTLLEYLGRDGVAQDPGTGWLPPGLGAELAESLGWQTSDAVAPPTEVLIDFARRARFIRRLKGRVVVKSAVWTFIEPGPRSLGELARAVTADSTRYGRSQDRDTADIALVLLGIADGSITCFSGIAEALQAGRRVVQAQRWDGYDEWLCTPMWDESDADRDISPAVQSLIDGLAALSSEGQYGAITPVTRAVARAALVDGRNW